METFVLALLCKPPLERITSHFVILPRQNRLFRLMYIFIIYRKAKIGKHLAYLAYIFNAFFLLGRFGRTGGRTGGFISAGGWSSAGNISR